MAKRWQVVVTPVAGTPELVELPAGVGQVLVAHDFTTGGSGTVEYSVDTVASGLADTPFAWLSLYAASAADTAAAGVYGSGLAGADVLPPQATVVKLTSNTTDQRFVLTGESYAS